MKQRSTEITHIDYQLIGTKTIGLAVPCSEMN